MLIHPANGAVAPSARLSNNDALKGQHLRPHAHVDIGQPISPCMAMNTIILLSHAYANRDVVSSIVERVCVQCVRVHVITMYMYIVTTLAFLLT